MKEYPGTPRQKPAPVGEKAKAKGGAGLAGAPKRPEPIGAPIPLGPMPTIPEEVDTHGGAG
eukprot:4855875-Prorocentrum_lima.AAC.1